MKDHLSLPSVILLILLALPAVAQDKMLSIEDASGLNRALMPKSLQNLQWMPDSRHFSYTANEKLVRGVVSDNQRDTTLGLDDLNNALKPLNLDQLKRFPFITWSENDGFIFNVKGKLLQYNLTSKVVTLLNKHPESAENVEMAPKGHHYAYTVENNLYLAIGGKEVKITNDEDPGIVNGQSVHRREFGIEKGTFWSPSGNSIAFYRKDERKVSDYPLVDISQPIAAVQNTKYPMAGDQSEYVKLGVYNLANGSLVFLETGDTLDHYLTAVTWGPDEKNIYVALLNRDQDHLWLNKYDALTGKFIKTLFEEKDDKYVEPEQTLFFLQKTPQQFLWLSERDGYNHFYLYDTEGKLIRQVTKGTWAVTDFLGFDQDEKNIFFLAAADSPLEQNTYKANLKNAKTTRLSYVSGTHQAVLSPDRKYFFDIYSSFKVSREYLLLNSGGNLEQVLLENEDPLENYILGETEIVTIKASDNTILYGRLILPPDLDPMKKYPVIVYVYGGPHTQLITDSWLAGAGLFLNYLAQQGYIVFTLDNRGSSNRGRAFEQAIHRKAGMVEMEDQMKGIEYLKSLDYVDPGRIGINGWSYGGFMTMTLFLKNPGVFKAACAGGPVIDWKLYEVMYTERYMDMPQQNPEGYKEANLLNYVDSLNGKLLIIHGTMDDVVVWQNSLSFIKKCVDKGKQLDYFVYPGHPHNVRGKDRAHLNRKIADYFKDNL